MGRKRHIEITVETEKVLVIRGRGEPVLAWCAACDAEVAMVAPDEAAALAGVSARAIYRQVEAGKLHYAETGDGRLLICCKSLPP